MRTTLRIAIIAMLSISWLQAEAVSLLRAAELTTTYLKSEEIDGRALNDLFYVVGLRRLASDTVPPADGVAWRIDLEETDIKRDDPRMTLMITEEGKKYRRVLEITNDGTVRFGKMPDFPRKVVVGTRVVPAPDKK